MRPHPQGGLRRPQDPQGPQQGSLRGLKVLEFTQVVAGPLAGGLLADLGADVVHAEPPGQGDPARVLGPDKDGTYLWWKVSGRNKRCVTLDARTAAGQELARRLVRWADVVITSIRSNTLEKWGLDWKSLQRENPKVIMLQISGYGATSSKASAPGFGKMGEARSGVVHLTGQTDGPPLHSGFSQADAVTGLMGAYAIVAALHRRDTDPDFEGEWIDVALFEPLFRLVEWQVIVHDQLGSIPTRAGNHMAVAPGAVINTYRSGDGEWITVSSATPPSVLRIVRLLGLPVGDFTSVEDQRRQVGFLDERLGEWIASRSAADALTLLEAADVVASRIYTVADIVADETYAERGDIITVQDGDLGPVRMPAVIPRFENNPGAVWRAGASLGADNHLVYVGWLKLSEEELAALQADGVV